jgi:hypothetical protein
MLLFSEADEINVINGNAIGYFHSPNVNPWIMLKNSTAHGM